MNIVSLPKKASISPPVVLDEWFITEGAQVAKGDLICKIGLCGEIIELQSPARGLLLKQMVKIGCLVDIDEPLAVIGQKEDDISSFSSTHEANIEKPKTDKESTTKMSKNTKQTSTGNVIPILLPQAGQSMEEGTILEWKVAEGDKIEVGQVIFEMETDKATMEVEAPDAGRLAKIVVPAGQTIEVKTPVAYIADNDEDVAAILPADEKSTPAPKASSGAKPDSVIPILLPQAGQSMEEGTILEWKVAEGDKIEVGQTIFEMETDKATMEVEAPDAGRLARIVVGPGETVEVKTPVAYIAENDSDVDAFIGSKVSGPKPAEQQQKQSAAKASAPQAKPAPVSASGRIKASPAAKRLAKERGIDLNTISTGSGPGGRIVTSDLDNAQAAEAGPRTLPMSKMRKAIARNLTYSKQNIPHFYIKATVEAEALFSLYKQTKQKFKCTVNDFVTLACARAISQYPTFRCQYKNDQLIEQPLVNVGIAVGTEEGLTVPVLASADKLTLKALSEQARQLVEGARNGKIEGMGTGIFTITNLGMFGTEEFSAIINPPEAAIIAVGAIREDVIAKDGKIIAARLMTLNLSVDHRVIDGVLAAQYMQTLKEILENPEQLLS